MSPLCSGNPESSGVWTCPYCAPCDAEKECYSIVTGRDGKQYKVDCGPPCNLAPFHAKNPTELWDHFREAHGWDGDLSKEPPRLLDGALPKTPPAPSLDSKVQLPVQKGPSKATRQKARAKRKKKKKR